MTATRAVAPPEKLQGVEAATLRAQILDLVGRYAALAHAEPAFEAGRSPIPVSGKVYGEPELRLLVELGARFLADYGAVQ